MKGTAAKGRKPKTGTARKKRTVRRGSRVERGRVTVQVSVAETRGFAPCTNADPWDGVHLGAGLVDTSRLACECGECLGCGLRAG